MRACTFHITNIPIHTMHQLDCIGVHVRVYTNCKNYTKYVHIKLDKLFLYLHKSRHLAFLWVDLRYPRGLLQNIYYISTRFYRLGKSINTIWNYRLIKLYST